MSQAGYSLAVELRGTMQKTYRTRRFGDIQCLQLMVSLRCHKPLTCWLQIDSTANDAKINDAQGSLSADVDEANGNYQLLNSGGRIPPSRGIRPLSGAGPTGRRASARLRSARNNRKELVHTIAQS